MKIEDVDDESVAGLGAVDEERAGERIIDLDVGERVAGLLERVAETVKRIGVKDVAGLEMGDGVGGAEGGFDVVHGSVEADDVAGGIIGGGRRLRFGGNGGEQDKG